MSFSAETGNLIEQLIQAEYKNACEKFGDKYHSLHEGYAILLEEVEEVKAETDDLPRGCADIWTCIKYPLSHGEKEIIKLLPYMESCVKCSIKELAQVGAVLQKIKNTLEVEE